MRDEAPGQPPVKLDKVAVTSGAIFDSDRDAPGVDPERPAVPKGDGVACAGEGLADLARPDPSGAGGSEDGGVERSGRGPEADERTVR